MAIEWIANAVSGTNDLFLWIDDNISSFGAYGAPYQDGLIGGDVLLVVGKIVLFLAIGFIGFRNRSLKGFVYMIYLRSLHSPFQPH